MDSVVYDDKTFDYHFQTDIANNQTDSKGALRLGEPKAQIDELDIHTKSDKSGINISPLKPKPPKHTQSLHILDLGNLDPILNQNVDASKEHAQNHSIVSFSELNTSKEIILNLFTSGWIWEHRIKDMCKSRSVLIKYKDSGLDLFGLMPADNDSYIIGVRSNKKVAVITVNTHTNTITDTNARYDGKSGIIWSGGCVLCYTRDINLFG